MIYENLPVYKATYDLLLSVFRLGRNMQREYRYTLGESMKRELTDLLVCIYKANAVRQKVPVLQEAREHVVVVKLQVRILADLRQISLRQYASIAEQIESVSRQLTAWQKSCDNTNK